jgi:hypothetical protein
MHCLTNTICQKEASHLALGEQMFMKINRNQKDDKKICYSIPPQTEQHSITTLPNHVVIRHMSRQGI